MSEIISPIKRWPGTVTLPDYLTFDQVRAYREASEAEDANADGAIRKWLPAICAIVTHWDLRGLPSPLTPDTWPATPPASAARLYLWLMDSITALFAEDEERPKE